MRVELSVAGKFQIFDLAKQLLKRDHLELLITSYPKFEVKKYGIPPEKVRSILIKEILQRSWQKLPRVLRNAYNPQYAIHEIFDRLASTRLVAADIFAGGSSFSLHTLRKAKKMGAITIIEHGSSHIAYQNRILKEEYERFGVKIGPFQLPDPRIIEKELQEYAEADYVAIPSLFNRRTFLDEGVPSNKIIQVPYGVDLSLFRQVKKNDDVFRVIFAGGLGLRKGTHYLLQAFAELNLPNSELLLIGAITEEIKPFLKKYEGKYKHITYQPMKELYAFYSQGSVFVMPSIEEGLALVQPQAMACGLPIIATTNTGAEDIVRDGLDGFIIPIRDVPALKEKILYMYEHPEERKRMSASAKEHVSSGFTWDDYGNKMIAEYERILNIKHKNA